MKTKISAAILALLMLITVFTACRQEEKAPAGEEATMGSNSSSSSSVVQNFAQFSQQKDAAGEAVAEETPEEFRNGLKNPDTASVSYKGDENITISLSDYCSKTVSVSTTGKLKLNSDISCLVINSADRGFTAKARADSLIISGEGITADIKSDTGKIYVEGKNAVINLEKGAVEELVVVNASAVINNTSGETVRVTLANGAFVSVPSDHCYIVKDNLVQKL